MTAFCTTDPSGNAARILPYTAEGPYCVLLTSVALAIGALIMGSTAVFIIHKAKVQWFHEVSYPSVLNCRDDVRYAAPVSSTFVLAVRYPSLGRLMEVSTDYDEFAASRLGDDDSVIDPLPIDRSFNLCSGSR